MNWKEDIENTPQSIRCWHLQEDVETKMEYSDGVSIYLISHNPEKGHDPQLYNYDFNFIQSVISDLDSYYIKAIEYIKVELRSNPEQFGISEQKAAEMITLKADNFPVDFPSVTFYDDNSWIIRFADADFPVINYGLGIIVFLKGIVANDMEIIPDEPETIE